MKTTKNCKHCYQLFEPRRSNHVYCTTSCKTKASYKRNNYTYVSGHYKKEQPIVVNPENKMVNTNEVLESIKAIEARIENLKPSNEISGVSISNSAIGSATADAAVFAVKKLFAPNSLPATKGDILHLRIELNAIKTLIQEK
ncbi:hypothetical protein DFQ10_1082 [Winogradskyella eximia]|uniref:Uncharacterized protein n=1 Tax=Winogradskyella eximia TaxID=262006 RepID=A0A3D9H182_9FLAO|nr:hypothetical protein [Winogradskyella eximia]RED42596.1 hypothetical protein DFQ10_1082 [Winogradskyella eximia]